MRATDMGSDGVIQPVAADPRRTAVGDAAQGQDGDLRRPAADVDHHRPARLRDGQACADRGGHGLLDQLDPIGKSEEHTSELQSLMRITYAVFCLKNNKTTDTKTTTKR